MINLPLPPSTGLQYKFITLVKDPTIINCIINCTLASTISLLHKELLSILSKVHKQYKDLTMTQCTPIVNMVEKNSHKEIVSIEEVHNMEIMVSRHMHGGQEWDDSRLIVRHDLVLLWSVFPCWKESTGSNASLMEDYKLLW